MEKISNIFNKHAFRHENVLIVGEFNMTKGYPHLDYLMQPFDLPTLINI